MPSSVEERSRRTRGIGLYQGKTLCRDESEAIGEALIPPTIFTHAKAHALMVILEQDEEDNWGYVARKHPSGSDAFVIDVMDSEGHVVGSL